MPLFAAISFIVGIVVTVAWRIGDDWFASRPYQRQADASHATPLRDRRPE